MSESASVQRGAALGPSPPPGHKPICFVPTTVSCVHREVPHVKPRPIPHKKPTSCHAHLASKSRATQPLEMHKRRRRRGRSRETELSTPDPDHYNIPDRDLMFAFFFVILSCSVSGTLTTVWN